jgi:hypothetical protein
MRYAAVLGTVALTELMAHFLSLGWGLMTLLAAFAWVALSGATVAAKARSTEDRLNAQIPIIGAAYATANTANTLAGNAYPKTGGTISGNVTVNGTHTVSGTLTASSGILSASMHATGNVQVDGSHTVNGNISGGTDISASNNLNAGGNLNGNEVVVSNAFIGGNQLHMQQSAGGWPMSSSQAWGSSVVNVLNQLAAAANNTGAFIT